MISFISNYLANSLTRGSATNQPIWDQQAPVEKMRFLVMKIFKKLYICKSMIINMAFGEYKNKI